MLGRPLRLSSLDTASRPEKAVRNVDKLADEGAVMLFGGASSAVAIAAGKRAKERGLLYFGTLTYSNDTTGKDGHRYMFRECNNAWMSARALGQELTKSLPGKRYFYVTADYTWGWTQEESIKAATEALGWQTIAPVRTPVGAGDFSQYITPVLNSGADVLILNHYGFDGVNSITQAMQFGMRDKQVNGKDFQIVLPLVSDLTGGTLPLVQAPTDEEGGALLGGLLG